jgi:protein-S-isoprenylcysteine O-methyltransferase Ste14
VLAVIGSAIFFVIAPVVVAGVVPWRISRWEVRATWLPARLLGALMVLSGAAVLLDSFARFAWKGLGTPAPVFPTRRLVVSGLYRYVRNPMYVAVVAAILGQALVFGDLRLLGYGAAVWLGFHVFVVFLEEPSLRATFGAEYDAFCAAVPRWIPRLSR